MFITPQKTPRGNGHLRVNIYLRTLLDQLESSAEKPSSFETEIETKIRNAALDGNSQLFLCLQDIAIAAENKSGFYKNVSAKTSKVNDDFFTLFQGLKTD